MTVKEKARELVDKYSCLHLGEDFCKWKEKHIVFDSQDKQCALIAVDLVIDNIEDDYLGTELNYWEEVKKEIEKL